MMQIIDVINKLSVARMEYQSSRGSVLNTFVVPFFIDRLDLRKLSHSVALAGSRGSGKSTYIQYFSQSTRFDKKLSNVQESEFECILLYWKPDIAYCQGLKENWLGDSATFFFSIHASLSLLSELSSLIDNVSHHYKDLIPSLNQNGNFWRAITKVTNSDIKDIQSLNNWIRDYKYLVSTRLNPINTDGLLSFEPKQMLIYLTEALREDYSSFKHTAFKVFVDEFELLNLEQQKLINTYRKESGKLLSWNVAYKLNAKPSKETTSDQWLQSPDDYQEQNLDDFIKEDYKIFAAEIFLLTLQNSGLSCDLPELAPDFLGNRDHIKLRREKSYQDKILEIINRILPTPSIRQLSELCYSHKGVRSKINSALNNLSYSGDVVRKINADISLAITILGIHKQRGFDPKLIEKYVLGKASKKEISQVRDKISTYEFNTLLSLNLQNSFIETPVYSGFDRFITMSTPNIRHYKELCLAALKHSEDLDSEANYESISDIRPISFRGMHMGVLLSSSALVKEVISYPPHGNKFSQLVNRIGELFKISQKSSYQTEPERNIFTFPYDYAGSDKELENFITSALSWRVIVEDESKRVKDDMQITNKEYRLNPIYAAKFGISYRKKRGVNFSLDQFKTIIAGSSESFELIKKEFQQRWKSDDTDTKQGLLL